MHAPGDPLLLMLLYFILPLWLAAGFADWLCHRATNIASTTGARESLLHLLMFAEVGVPLLAVMFFEVNALIIATMLVAFVMHEATALWDVSYAWKRREIRPFEQHVHSFLELIPLMAIIIVISRHWGQFLALFGLGGESARFDLVTKSEPLPLLYVAVVLAAVLLFELLPFLEEFIRGWRANKGRLVPSPTRSRSHVHDESP
jgi:hypothetical protein